MMEESTIRAWWDALHVYDGEVMPVEVRILDGSATYSGYFTDIDSLVEQLKPYEGMAMYATVNPCKEAMMDRVQGGGIMRVGKNPTTSGSDIEGRCWILVDIDPERPAGTNATDEEKKQAFDVMCNVYRYLRKVGFNAPVVADSANGYHLYYRVQMGNTPEYEVLVKNFLKVLGMYFSTEAAKVDLAVFDPNRISKIIGTASAKGRNTRQRPQRVSAFVHIPEEIKMTDVAFVRKVAGELPEAPKPSKENHYSHEPFDLDGFISQHGIEVLKRSPISEGGEKLILKECPFDSTHKDAALFRMSSGAIAFKCFHNSCQSYGWKDFRLHYDPQAYDRKALREYNDAHRFDRRNREAKPVIPQTDELGKKWFTAEDIVHVNPNSVPFIPTGVRTLDSVMLGLTMGDVTIVSGLAGSGKTSLLGFIALNAIEKGFRVASWSGELQGYRYMNWLHQMAAGRAHVVTRSGYSGIYYCPDHIATAIDRWLGDSLLVYNNDYGNRWSQLLSDIRELIGAQHPDLILIDNLTALDLDGGEYDRMDRQKDFINEAKSLAKKENIHIVLVCHPRKEQNFHLLRMESISGSSDLFNLCDNVLLVHRKGEDFDRRMKEFFGPVKAEEYSVFDTVIEIAKNRSHGKTGYLIGMYFEPETRRLMNSVDENIVYGWDDTVPRMMPAIGFDDDLPPD